MADTVKKIMAVAYGDVKKIGTRPKANIKKLFHSKGEQTGTSTITGCDLDGFARLTSADGFSDWSTAIAATSAGTVGSTSAGTGDTLFISLSRGDALTSRAYFRFTGFESDITSVTAATLKVHFSYINNQESSADGAIKWKAFKHNDLSITSIAGGTFRNDNNSAGWNQSISGDEATVSVALISFPITGDLLSYVSTQAQAGGKVAFMLVSKFDYTDTDPSTSNSVKISFTESDDDPQLEYSWTK
tara:strand:+ start:388 stop:1122 length:735 start_codon:yes stop_codon:yes gene_type:complete